MIRAGQVFLGPRFSVNNELQRFAPRDPGEPLDGIGQFLYPARFSTPPAPPGAKP
jgi:menaquinol-cytochrome c reductase iron-sulfur subunit